MSLKLCKYEGKTKSKRVFSKIFYAFLPCIFTLLVPCLFSKNKKAIIVLKRQKYQPRNTKGFIAKKKSHRFNRTGWVITFKIILT